MTLGVTGQSQAVPTAANPAVAAPAGSAGQPSTAANPASLRVKRITLEDLQGVLQAHMAAEQAAGVQPSDAQLGAQALAASVAASVPAAAATPGSPVIAAAPTSPAPPASLAAPAAGSGTAAPIATAATPPVASSSIAPRRKDDYWTAHIAQFRGKYLPDGPTMRPNCGPASVTVALRLIGKDIPGFNGERSAAVLDKARIIGTGKNDVSVGTTDTELEKMIEAGGARWSESSNLGEMLGWVKQGIPVVLAGNPKPAWNKRYSPDQVYPYDGGHWVTVSGYDPGTGYYVVNDPLSQIGPIYVSEQELSTYNRSHGGLGIAVFR